MELTAELARDAEQADAALRQSGYEPIDADQWGRSYRHREDPRRTAELDEREDRLASVRLVLRHGDLEPPGVGPAEGELELLYSRMPGTPPDQFDEDA